MPPAARLTDMHTCPMQTPGTPPIPHVGGPIMGPGSPVTLIAGLPAARVGDQCTCVGPPDVIVKGSATVMIGGVPAARLGDPTAHGGAIVAGCLQVMIDDVAGSAAMGAGIGAAIDALARALNRPLQKAALREAARSGAPFCEACETARREPFMAPPESAAPAAAILKEAAAAGVPFCEKCEAARAAEPETPTPVGRPATSRARARRAAGTGSPFWKP